jgi:signal transduction histidine kinase
MTRWITRLFLIGVAALLASHVVAQAATRHVVLLFDERVELPGLSALEADLVRTLRENSAEPIEVYREAMDLSRFGSASYTPFLRDVLKRKYENKKIDVAVGVMSPSLNFLLAFGAEIFPGTPIIFCGVDKRQLGDRVLPPHVRGILLKREFEPTLGLALHLHRATEKVVVVSGSSEFDTGLLAEARAQFRSYDNRVAFSYLEGLRLPQLLDEVAKLPSGTIVLFISFLRDAADTPYVPHDVVDEVSRRSSVPVYGFVDQYLGRGIVGGKLYSLATHGREAALLILRSLNGADAGPSVPIETPSQVLAFDWRQMQRWGIAENDLPQGSEVRYRDQSLWRSYMWQITLFFLILLLQASLILGLLYERRQRHNAEVLARQRMADLAHANRFSTAGELTASIAHELNQPLGAILANAETAELMLNASAPDLNELKQILADICRDDRRAGEIVSHARSMLKKAPFELKRIDLNEIARDTVNFISSIKSVRATNLSTSLTSVGLPILGDAILLQQVIMNLLLNAADAMAQIEPEQRQIVVRTERVDHFAELSVSDSGPGISPDKIERVFDRFFTTKKSGMGLGLSIARSIVEAHGGKISVENRREGGAIFRIRLPICADQSLSVMPTEGERLRA